MSEVEEIKQRLDIVDIVREYAQLKQAGANWKALCPFHNEKTPSFMVSGEKQIWHCFGCDEGGDIFTFVQKIEGIDFPEALRILADKAGVKLKKTNPKLKNEKTRLMDTCGAASRFFHKVLLETGAGEIARSYLAKRGVSSEAIEDFRLGYAPDSWDTLSKALGRKGFNEKEIFLAGLSVKKDPSAGLRTGKGAVYYDRFRGRLMFPICDVYGNVVGFTGRILKEAAAGAGKYVNTPQTAIYDKGRLIYGLDKAKQAIKEADLAVLVEGNMDVVASHQAGIKNVVAVSGTALTIDQIRLLKRYTKNIALAFDADPAGEGACERSIDLALGEEMNVRIIAIPEGKDPDDCIKSRANGAEVWREAIYNSKSIMEYYFSKIFAKYDISKIEEKKKAGDILLRNIAKISNKIEQTHWLQKLSESLKVPERVLWESLPEEKKVKIKKIEHASNIKHIPPTDRKNLISSQLIAAILKFPQYLSLVIEKVMPEMLSGDTEELYKQLVYYYNKNTSVEIDIFLDELNDDLRKRAEKLLLLADKDFSNNDFKEKDIRYLLEVLIAEFKRQKRSELAEQIKQAEISGDSISLEKLMKDFQKFAER